MNGKKTSKTNKSHQHPKQDCDTLAGNDLHSRNRVENAKCHQTVARRDHATQSQDDQELKKATRFAEARILTLACNILNNNEECTQTSDDMFNDMAQTCSLPARPSLPFPKPLHLPPPSPAPPHRHLPPVSSPAPASPLPPFTPPFTRSSPIFHLSSHHTSFASARIPFSPFPSSSHSPVLHCIFFLSASFSLYHHFFFSVYSFFYFSSFSSFLKRAFFMILFLCLFLSFSRHTPLPLLLGAWHCILCPSTSHLISSPYLASPPPPLLVHCRY